jgi:hypothetical protein
MRSTSLLSVGAIVMWFALGLVRGGNFRWGCRQICTLLSGILYAGDVSPDEAQQMPLSEEDDGIEPFSTQRASGLGAPWTFGLWTFRAASHIG